MAHMHSSPSHDAGADAGAGAGAGAGVGVGGGGHMDHGWQYDLQVWRMDLLTLRGAIRTMRRTVLDRSGLAPGGSLLDVGCGPGGLALRAARRAGPAGRVAGLDPTPGQIGWARTKARWLCRPVDFREGSIESLPFPDGSFDAVTSTLMLHHLSPEVRGAGLAEIGRVLRPGGRLVVADFDPAPPEGSGAGSAPASVDPAAELIGLLESAGFRHLSIDRAPLPRVHRGWSGVTVVTATVG